MKTNYYSSNRRRTFVLLLYSILTITPGFALDIACLSGGNSCFNGAEPEGNAISYFVKSSTPNESIIQSSISWSVKGGEIEGPSRGNEIIKIRWDNTPNNQSYGHDISVSAIVLSGSSTTTKALTRNVTVKYIGPIQNFHIDGASVSNNSSKTVHCGRHNVDVVANHVTTDPPAPVTYTWSFPSGWTGTSTTSNPEALPYTNAGGEGYLKLTAQRTDGQFKQTYQVYIKRPKVGSPSLSASTPLTVCNGQVQTISVNASNNPTSFKWKPSGSITSISATNHQTYRFRNSNRGRISVTVDNSCITPQTKSFDVFSTPILSSATVDGATAQSVNFIDNPALLRVTTLNSSDSYSWQITNGSGSIYPNFSQCTAYAYPFTIVKAMGSNQCGSANLFFFYLQRNGGYYKILSPNPATNRIIIEFREPDYIQDHLEELSLSSSTEVNVRRFDVSAARASRYFDGMNRVELKVAGLKSGYYFLNITIAGRRFVEKILIE